MLQVPHRIEPMPEALYMANHQSIKAGKKSHWKFPQRANSFYVTKPRDFKYTILCGPNVQPPDQATCDARLSAQFSKCGLTAQQCIRIPNTVLHTSLPSTNQAVMEERLRQAEKAGANLVILLLKGHDVAAYRNFKDLADRTFGLQSICMTLKRGKDAALYETMTNIMMKVNLKFGGINHVVDGVSRWLKNTMVIGADLVHPGPGSYPGTPSIAAIVGSVDYFGGKCLGSLRLQNVHKTDREVRAST